MGVQGTLAKISLCRTAALGGRWYSCDDCGETTKLHNSCGDRHCPGCSGSKRADFNDRASKLVTPGVEHFQVIFTVPEIISTLALANRSEIADLLFKSAWHALEKTIVSEQGYEPAALMVLHTWNQKLDAHWHVHALVPGVGPAVGGQGVKETTSPYDDGSTSKSYLVDCISLRRAYRKAFLRGLKSLYRRGKLSFSGSTDQLRCQGAWDDLMERLGQQEWVSHIEPPPSELSQADHVVSYMTRYLTGGPISDYRIESADDREVTFLAREGRRTGGTREQVPLTLSTGEFVRRWCLHIQPHQLTNTRCFGGWANSKREAYRQRMDSWAVAEASAQDQLVDPPAASLETEATIENKKLCCDSCGSESLRLSSHHRKPSWSALLRLDSQSSPWWYQESQEKEEKRLWDEAMGEGFYDWYVVQVKTPSESARGPDDVTKSPQVQLLLPGMAIDPVATGNFRAGPF